MSDEGKLRLQAERGSKAKEFMDAEVVQDALSAMEESITKQWKAELDPEVRERLWYTLQGHITFREYMTAVIANGRAATQELQDILKTKEGNN